MNEKNKTKKDLIKDLESLDKKNKKLQRSAKKLKNIEEELIESKKEQEDLNLELERAIDRDNQLTIESAISQLEFNQIINSAADGMWVVNKEFEV